MSSHAQTTFFTAGFANLHQLVLLQLADSKTGSRHPVLPLLGVSRYWRAFAREFLLKPYQMTKVDPKSYKKHAKRGYPDQPTLTKGGAYLKFSLTSYCIMESPFQTDDPRYFFSKEGSDMPSIFLLLQSCDPSTLMCTFLPAGSADHDPNPFASFGFTIQCNEDNKRPFPDVPPSFALSPSTWFVKERKRGSGVWGQDLAFAPGKYPEPGPLVLCPEVDEPGAAAVVEPNEKCGWSTDFSVVRIDGDDESDEDEEASAFGYEAPAVLVMRTVMAPLAGLYRPYNISDDQPFEDMDDY